MYILVLFVHPEKGLKELKRDQNVELFNDLFR